MKSAGLFIVGAVCGVGAATMSYAATHLRQPKRGDDGSATPASEVRVHTDETLTFKARGTMSELAPIFGADKERLWAADWDPQFVHPQPAADERGMVFTVDRHERHEMWVNTEFDLQNGRLQYVYVIPDVMVTVITLRLRPLGEGTGVEVKYERTSLSPQADEHVRQMAEGDRRAGREWQRAVNGYLAKPNR
jgi:hypothetical protein